MNSIALNVNVNLGKKASGGDNDEKNILMVKKKGKNSFINKA